ncbi:permease prefix domain 1-containing protein [Clostridium weizhouense]|uniref:Permease prefix domain 1-containing protein n=1 Tax=Clostridium weizhouense TaxID=2859781 RepID=A0ABS7ASU0_9CLOT|nr:permease prefix domain 1-containing protein [Clostridium weizhouense]MBW6411738.1 permease prefix domain 1-containing protein [Clostridium weizhouense]
METIKNYLDTMFSSLPKTSQILKLKNDLLENMEEKYNELKDEGKSENEAIGIVISEFGNIDELINELEIDTNKNQNILPTITSEEAYGFINTKKRAGLLIGIGVFLCILSAAMLILITSLIENNIVFTNLSKNDPDLPGVITLFIMIVPAVALFIYSGMELKKYNYLKKPFELPINVKSDIEQKFNAFSSTYMISLIVGVCLCVLSPIAVLITDSLNSNASDYGVVLLLTIVAIAVFIFIYFGNIKESFNILLKIKDFSKEQNKVVNVVASIIWPLAVCIFLITGFIFHIWHINWIIFPITGILFGMFSSVYNILKGENK